MLTLKNINNILKIALLSAVIVSAAAAGAQTRLIRVQPRVQPETESLSDSLDLRVRQMVESPGSIADTLIVMQPLSRAVFIPMVYTHFQDYSDFKPFEKEYSGVPAFRWFEEANAAARNEGMLRQRFMLRYPYLVRYNLATLPVAPRQYTATVDPKKHTIKIEEVLPDVADRIDLNIQKRHWLRTFNASLQFSQAYISPNWYQGGNNNLNVLANLYYNVKLNPKFHPNLLFESTFQYKLGLNNAPDDTHRDYAISEDLLQLNTTFGLKAAHHWYYSLTAQFKTQILNSYVKNSDQLNSAFLSPAELTAGVGMTYNTSNKKKGLTFDASLAPLSYNMKICTRSNDDLEHANFDIPEDKSYKMKFGSSAELKLQWQITYNILLRSRLFGFTDYSYFQGDWENTVSMDINRYLSTQIYVHMRYDSTTPRCDDKSWHKLQAKEILSFGLTYKFSSL